MSERIFPTTEAMQAGIVAEADDRTLILTSGGRLARQLQHAFRLEGKQKGRPGWLRPQILSLNTWILKLWQGSWPEEIRPSSLRILRLWEEAVKGGDLPEGLSADIQLYQLLEETFQAKIRNKVPPPGNGFVSPLISWREEVFRRFERLIIEQGLIHPAYLPLKVLQGIVHGAHHPPEKIFLVGFEFPAPIEKDLLQVLNKRFGAIYCSTREVQAPILRAVSLPNQEEEVIWLGEQILAGAQHTPLHRIGLVVPSFSQYAPLLAGTFRELIGPAINDDGGSYNLSLGQPLLNQPLVQAGLLPLSFCLEGQSRTLFLSLLLSPFYQIWKPHVTGLAQADRLWRKESIDADLEALLNCLHQHNFPGLPLINPPGVRLETLLAAFRVREQRGADWVKALRLCWQVLGFPVISEPGEEGFYQHLLSILQELENDLNGSLLDGSQFYAWLKYLLTQTLVNEPGYEQAGIQILGLIEARGLAFDHLFLGGLSKGSLPQAVRTFPFLTPEERRSVQGATYKSQFEFAQGAFAHLKTTAPKMTLTRPEEEQGDPLPPSPFWPEVAEKTERNIWTVPGPAWTRTEWLKQTVQGIHHYPQPLPPDDLPATLPSPPPTLSVTALETFLACPFKFFAGQILGLNPLEEIIIGISPPERGEVLHTILALITKTIRQQEGYEKNSETLFPIIKQCVQMVIQGRYGDPYWLVEQRRLIGEGLGPGGLLGIWLEKEFTRREEGWRWEKEEISFPHLKLSSWSFPLKGRIDRIDYNSLSGEVCCWDYKTGHLPHSNDITKHFLAPQLPIYLWAVKKQPHYVSDPIKGLRAGYLGLRSEGEFSLQEPFKQSEDWERCLQEWEEVVKGAQKEIISGLFSADPKPEPKGSDQAACSYCPYKCLCVYWKKN